MSPLSLLRQRLIRVRRKAGRARMKGLTAAQRRELARQAAIARWTKPKLESQLEFQPQPQSKDSAMPVDTHFISILPDPTAEQSVDLEFYVTVIADDGRYGLLLGAYSTHDEAKANVNRGNNLACEANAEAVWHSYGTASLRAGSNAKTMFGR